MSTEFPDVPTRIEKFEDATQFISYEKLPGGKMLLIECDKQRTPSVWISKKKEKIDSTYYVEIAGELYRYDKEATLKVRGAAKPIRRGKSK